MANLSTPLIPVTGKMVNTYTAPLIVSVFICSLASIQYGFHMSELNAPSRYIRLSLGINQSELGFLTSIFSIGGLISSTFASYISKKYGLRISFIITSLFYIVGSFIEGKSELYHWFLIGRFTSGIAAGLAIVYVPVYMNDISPIELRGVLGSVTQISVNLGILIAQCLAIKWNTLQLWRSIIDFGWILGILQLILVIFFLVESPKWLIVRHESNEREREMEMEKGFDILHKLRGIEIPSVLINEEIMIWKAEKESHLRVIESQPHLKNLGFWYYLTDLNYFNSRTIATFMMLGQQFGGINSVIFYGVDILNKVFPTHALMINIIISIGNTIITSISSLFLDKLGRKPLLLISLNLMIISLIILSIGIINNIATITILSIFTYVGSFAIGCGPIPFLIISETSQLEVKDLAQSWATDINWISVFIVGTLFPILNSIIGGWTYLIFASFCIAFAIFVKFFVPETKGCATYDDVWGSRVD